jgi:hypothetical protein
MAQEEPQHKLKRMLVKHGSSGVSDHGVANAEILRSKHTTVSQDEGLTFGLERCEEGSGHQAEDKVRERIEPCPFLAYGTVQLKSHASRAKNPSAVRRFQSDEIEVEVLYTIISRYH